MRFKEAGEFILNKLAKELPGQLSYHSIAHTQDVYNTAEQIGKAEGITAQEMKLLLTAAWFHDSGFVKGAAEHEEESCNIAKNELPKFAYTAAEIEQICGMIMATRIPQTPKNLLEQIIADADLDYLGRDDFFSIGDTLFKELAHFGIVRTDDDWNRIQVNFLEKHHFFTRTAINLRQAKKEEHLRQVKQKLNNSQ